MVQSTIADSKIHIHTYFLIIASNGNCGLTRSEHYSPRVEGLIPLRGSFFAEFILL